MEVYMPLPFLAAIPFIGGLLGTTGALCVTAAAVSATTVVAGGAVLATGGLITVAAMNLMLEERETKGIKTGYANASKEYSAKLIKQEETFNRVYKKLIKEITELKTKNAQSEQIIEEYKKVVGDLLELIGNLEGCIKKLKEDGYSDADLKEELKTLKRLNAKKKKIEKSTFES